MNKQNNDIQDLISRGVKVLILNPVNPQAVEPSIEAAKNAGIPVITVDRPVEKGAITHVGRDNVKMGLGWASGTGLPEVQEYSAK